MLYVSSNRKIHLFDFVILKHPVFDFDEINELLNSDTFCFP